MLKHELRQPFKQAHREVNLLTDAERATATYSNRFASHILRQHQFKALCDARGWTYNLMGNFDFHSTPRRQIDQSEYAAEFWVNELPPDTSPAEIFLYISTDQVRFYNGLRLINVADVPPRIFSELMRDVDLFVGVASIGNDPDWTDNGPQRRFANYWRDCNVAELSETARTRRELLETLLPRLTKLDGLWSLDERFLIIKGKLHSYKIHLGSGNILMSPNDQYLCIVPDRTAKHYGSRVFLPFEGDATLSTILSKAFMLAAPSEITDPTILRQVQ